MVSETYLGVGIRLLSFRLFAHLLLFHRLNSLLYLGSFLPCTLFLLLALFFLLLASQLSAFCRRVHSGLADFIHVGPRESGWNRSERRTDTFQAWRPRRRF